LRRADSTKQGYGLFGDGVHNFIDGLIIAAAFVESTSLGLVVSLGVILHEIPQEIGDFSTLLLAGFNKKKALLMNFLVALTNHSHFSTLGTFYFQMDKGVSRIRGWAFCAIALCIRSKYSRP